MRLLLPAIVLVGAVCGCASTDSRLPDGDWYPGTDLKELSANELLVTVPLAERSNLEATGRALGEQYGLELIAEWPLKSLGIHCFVFRSRDAAVTPPLIARLEADTRVDSAQPMYVFRVLGASYNDRYAGLQHGLKSMRVMDAHRWVTGKGVRVAVIDTGVDAEHPDLRDRIVLTKNFVGDKKDDAISETHGTAVAGIIAAQGDNRIGIVGVAPRAELLALRGCWQDRDSRTGHCSSFTLARAVNFAILRGSRVLNVSLSGPHDPLLERLLTHALDNGTSVVAAYPGVPSGQAFPASLPGVTAVRAAPGPSGPESAVAEASQFTAPGVDILTTVPNGGYDFFSGSSFAAAQVSGIVALLLEYAPHLTPAEVQTLLRSGQPAESTGQADSSGGGSVVDAYGAVTALQQMLKENETTQRLR